MFSTIQAARFLGWTSIAVGLTEIVATRWVEETIGTDEHESAIRAFGAREIAAGITILAQPGLNKSLAAGVWSRVAGDAVDLAALEQVAQRSKNPAGLEAITSIVLAVTGMDLLVALLLQRDLWHAKHVSIEAKKRVNPVNAVPMRGSEKTSSGSLIAAGSK
jgi:hypothetical protein